MLHYCMEDRPDLAMIRSHMVFHGEDYWATFAALVKMVKQNTQTMAESEVDKAARDYLGPLLMLDEGLLVGERLTDSKQHTVSTHNTAYYMRQLAVPCCLQPC